MNEVNTMKLVAERAKKEIGHYGSDMFSYLADLHTADMDVGLDFAKLLGFDKFNFAHDILGISKHVDRYKSKLDGTFTPRSTKEAA